MTHGNTHQNLYSYSVIASARTPTTVFGFQVDGAELPAPRGELVRDRLGDALAFVPPGLALTPDSGSIVSSSLSSVSNSERARRAIVFVTSSNALTSALPGLASICTAWCACSDAMFSSTKLRRTKCARSKVRLQSPWYRKWNRAILAMRYHLRDTHACKSNSRSSQ